MALVVSYSKTEIHHGKLKASVEDVIFMDEKEGHDFVENSGKPIISVRKVANVKAQK